MTTKTLERRSPVRLTRRGRFALVLSVMVALVVAGFGLGRSESLAAGRVHPPARHTVVVQAGETLWAVAVRAEPNVDPRRVVAEIESANHLRTAAVEPGEQLVLPIRG
jgi:hypothetical protein